MTVDLPEGYRDLQKLAGAVDKATGNGKKEEIRESLEAAPEEKVREAKEKLGFQEPENPEKQENNSKEKNKSPEEGKQGDQEPSDKENPDLSYTSDRDQGGDMFDRDNPEEEVYKSRENEENGGDQEEQDQEEDAEEEKPDSQEAEDRENIEIDTDVFRYPHLILNKVMRKLVARRFDAEVPPLNEKELEELSDNTELVAREKLSGDKLRRLESHSGVFGIVFHHGKKLLEAWATEEDPDKTTDENKSEEAEHLENDLDTESEENQEEGKFDGVTWD